MAQRIAGAECIALVSSFTLAGNDWQSHPVLKRESGGRSMVAVMSGVKATTVIDMPIVPIAARIIMSVPVEASRLPHAAVVIAAIVEIVRVIPAPGQRVIDTHAYSYAASAPYDRHAWGTRRRRWRCYARAQGGRSGAQRKEKESNAFHGIRGLVFKRFVSQTQSARSLLEPRLPTLRHRRT
jgi:hypothetical protein